VQRRLLGWSWAFRLQADRSLRDDWKLRRTLSEFPGESFKLTLSIGDLRFAFLPKNTEDLEKLKGGYSVFQVFDVYSDIVIHFSTDTTPNLHNWEMVFDSGGLWQLHRNRNRWALSLSSPILGPKPYQTLILDQDFKQGTVYRSSVISENQALPLEHALAEILMVSLLSKERGVLLHGCAIQDGETGRLLLGNSGAGKSTMAHLWGDQKNVSILSDDRVIVRKKGNRFWMYGTPWHGEACFAANRSIPIEQIFTLRHGEENQAKPLDQLQAAQAILTRSFPTFWDTKGMEFTLMFLEGLVQAVPCYDLSFYPESAVVDYIRNLNYC
jgi:hypothetical protein